MPSSKFTVASLPDLSNKTYVVTGGNTGCGYWTVAGLAARGAKVYMGARSKSKADAAIQEIKMTTPSANIHFLELDLSNFSSVLKAAKVLLETESALHGLINNAGIMGVPFAMTEDGFEVQLQTNYLSHWLLTHHLLPLLRKTSAATGKMARLVNVTSDGHDLAAPKDGIKFDDISLETSNAMARYGQSKLANILHAKELSRRYGPESSNSTTEPGKVCFSAVHPGHIDTNLNKQATGMAPGMILRVATPIMRCVGILDAQDKGALSSLWAIASDGFKPSDSGAYIVPYAVIGTPSAYARDPELATKLYDWTESQLSKKGLLTMK